MVLAELPSWENGNVWDWHALHSEQCINLITNLIIVEDKDDILQKWINKTCMSLQKSIVKAKLCLSENYDLFLEECALLYSHVDFFAVSSSCLLG